jgi:hypothetical protein
MMFGTREYLAELANGHKVAAQRARAATLRPAQAQLAARMSEAKLAESMGGMVLSFGLYSFHPHRSERKEEAGWLDETIIGTGGTGALYRELKNEKHKVEDSQLAMLERLWAAGLDADVWRPTDWYSGRIERELRSIAAKNVKVDAVRYPQLTEPAAWGEW